LFYIPKITERLDKFAVVKGGGLIGLFEPAVFQSELIIFNFTSLNKDDVLGFKAEKLRSKDNIQFINQ